MSRYGQSLSLANVASSTGVGAAVVFPVGHQRFTVQVELAGTTKAVVRLQGSANGITWSTFGATAGTTFADGDRVTVSSSSASLATDHSYDHVRARLISRTTSASAVVESVSAWITARDGA